MRFIPIALFFLFSISIFSETILLKGKETIKGKVKNQNINSVKIDVNGEIKEIPKDRILKIVYRDLNKVEEEKIRAEEERKLAEGKTPAKKIEEEKPPEETKKPSKDAEPKIAEDKLKEEEKKNTEITQKKEDPKKNRPGRIAVTLRSTLIPGWGQFIEKRKIAAFVYPSLMIGVGILAYNENKRYKDSLKDYNAMTNPSFETQIIIAAAGGKLPSGDYNNYLIYNQKATVRKHYEHARNLGYAVLAIYLINIIDAYLFYNENAFAENRTRGFYMDYQLQSLSSQTPINQSNLRYDQVYTIGYSFRF